MNIYANVEDISWKLATFLNTIDTIIIYLNTTVEQLVDIGPLVQSRCVA